MLMTSSTATRGRGGREGEEGRGGEGQDGMGEEERWGEESQGYKYSKRPLQTWGATEREPAAHGHGGPVERGRQTSVTHTPPRKRNKQNLFV